MKLQQESQGQSSVTSGCWDNWVGDQEQRFSSVLPVPGNDEERNRQSQHH